MSQTSGVATISAFQLILRVLRNIKVVQECLGVINCPLAYWQQGLAGTQIFFTQNSTGISAANLSVYLQETHLTAPVLPLLTLPPTGHQPHHCYDLKRPWQRIIPELLRRIVPLKP